MSGSLDLFETSETDAGAPIGDGLHWPQVRGWLQTHAQTLLDDRSLLEEIGLRPHGRNVVDFGVFVDIGVHQDGLVHISQICDRFIKHPSQAVAVGDVVKVVVLEVDEKKHRISLSMRQAAGKK